MATSNNVLIADALAAVPDVKTKLAVYVERVGFKVRVNIGLTSVVLPFVGLYLPPPGHAVRMDLSDGYWVVSGPASPLPGYGTIIATGSPLAVVTAWGVSYELPYRTSYTPVLNDVVGITWSADGGVIEGKASAVSSSTGPGANPGSGLKTYHPKPFTARGSGSYRDGRWWTNDVYASSTNDGAWWYGSKIKDTIPDSAQISAARIYLPVRSVVVNAPGSMRLHTDASQPGGAPAFSGSSRSVPARTGWVDVPTSWIDYLKANSGGIGFDGGGYWSIKGTGSDAQSGALDITYKA